MIAVINGPNLNRLGCRDKNIYGSFTLQQLQNYLNTLFGSENLIFYQSNIEGRLIDFIQECNDRTDMRGIVINPGAFAHYSYALADALADSNVPVVEVHISNIHSREEFRHNSVTAKACVGVIAGLGKESYRYAIEYLISQSESETRE